MPLQDLRNWLAAGIAVLMPSILSAAPLPVNADRFEGEVMYDVGAAVRGLSPGQVFEPATRIRTGADGRVEFSVQAVPTLKLGGRADLLLHSVDKGVLRAKLSGGALSVDTRARKGANARDLRLNVGDLRLRIHAAEAWVQLGEEGSLVCLVSGSIDAQVADQPGRLDTPGQCLRHSGLTSMWSMVPQSVLADRVGLTQVRAPLPSPPIQTTAAVASVPAVVAPPIAVVAPAAPAPVPAPEPASERAPGAAGAAIVLTAAVQAPEIPPVPVPAPNPTMPAAESSALGLTAAAALPEIPPEPVVVPNPKLPVAEPVTLNVAQAMPAPEIPPAPVAPPAPAPTAPPVAEAAREADRVNATPVVVESPSAVPASPVEAPNAVEDATAPTVAAVLASIPAEQPDFEIRQDAEIAADEAAAAALAVAATAEPIPDDGRRWSIVLASFPLREPADKEVSRFKLMGLEAEAREYRVGARHGFRVGLGRYASREEADTALTKLSRLNPEIVGWLAKY